MIDSYVYTQRIDMKSYGTMEGVYINGATQVITHKEIKVDKIEHLDLH